MRILPIVGGWYGENLPSGEYAVAVPGRGVETHQGFVPNPPNSGLGPLYLRITNVNGFAMAGQPHDGPKGTLYWDSPTVGWRLLTPVSYGVSGHIFDQQGVLRILEAGPNQTSQGYRYVARDGRLVLGDETYTDPARQIWEWTEYDGITIGQGEQGAIVLANGKRYLLEPDDCRFIRFNKVGNDCAVTIVKLAERRTILKWFTVAEIASLPVIGTAPAPNPPPPDPGHPAPPKEPPVSDRTDVVVKWKEAVERAGIPVTGSLAGAFEVTKRVAWELRNDGIGLLIKLRGENIVEWRDDLYSAGRVAYGKNGRTYPIKIFTDVPATNGPKWDVGTEPVPDDQFWGPALEPEPLGTAPEDPEDPDSPPPPFPDPNILALVDSVKALASTLDAMAQEVADIFDKFEALETRIAEIARRLGEVQEQQYQALDGRVPVFGGTVVLTPRRAKG